MQYCKISSCYEKNKSTVIKCIFIGEIAFDRTHMRGDAQTVFWKKYLRTFVKKRHFIAHACHISMLIFGK